MKSSIDSCNPLKFFFFFRSVFFFVCVISYIAASQQSHTHTPLLDVLVRIHPALYELSARGTSASCAIEDRIGWDMIG